jgi:hypothetical protein
MADSDQDTHAKALSINLDPSSYGTIAEIGAGQEVARWFLQAGGASGTVARTVSAYDMTFSDALYGKAGRYVSRERLEGMLDYEYALLLERLGTTRGGTTRFFAFADTASARNFAGTNECHAWVGLRYQSTPGGPPNDVILHVNFLDPSNLQQQQAVGILGVNLIFAAFHRGQSGAGLSAAIYADLANRLEIDLIALRGPDFSGIDESAANLELLREAGAEAIVLPVGSSPVPMSELLRKRPLVLAPAVLLGHEPVHAAMLEAARTQLTTELDASAREPLPLFILTAGARAGHEPLSIAQLVHRADTLRALGSAVLVARAPELYHIVRFALRYTDAPIRIVIGAPTVADVLQAQHYRHLDGALMEALAQLFACNVRVYVHPVPQETLALLDPASAAWITPPAGAAPITLDNLVVPHPTAHLFNYLVDSGFTRGIESSPQGTQRHTG